MVAIIKVLRICKVSNYFHVSVEAGVQIGLIIAY